jgi:hypothetical protein
VIHTVTAVIQNNVWHTELIDHTLQEFLIALVTDPNKYPGSLVLLELLLDIDADDPGQRSEVPLPHRGGTTACHSDLKKSQ